MKTNELRGAIRKMKGNPSIEVALTPGKAMTLVLQKTQTLESLASAYPGNEETGLTLNENTGLIAPVGSIKLVSSLVTIPLSPHGDDEDDML